MEIRICGHRRAAEILREHPNEIDVIFISSPDAKFAVQNSALVPQLARECCELLFHDISMATDGYANHIPPSRWDVEKALEFAKGRDRLLVCCQAGISRSSAIAYSIMAAEVGPEEALKVLDENVHMPNGLIVKHVSNILGKPEIVDIMDRWKFKADEVQSEQGPSLW